MDHVDIISRRGIAPFDVKKTVRFSQPRKSGVPQFYGPEPETNQETSWSTSSSTLSGQVNGQSQEQQVGGSTSTNSSATPKEGGTMGLVLDRLEQWLQSHNRDHLPKSKQKLRGAIKPMCSVKTTSGDVDAIMKRLETEKFIQHATEVSVKKKGKVRVTETHHVVKYPQKVAADVSKLSSARQSYADRHAVKDESEVAYQKCKAWVSAPLNSPKSADSLRNSLAQLCITKQSVEVDTAIEAMVTHGMIAIDNDGKVVYLK